MKDTNNNDALPQELLEHIFSFFSIRGGYEYEAEDSLHTDTILSIAEVCQSWRQAIKSHPYWKSTCFVYNSLLPRQNFYDAWKGTYTGGVSFNDIIAAIHLIPPKLSEEAGKSHLAMKYRLFRENVIVNCRLVEVDFNNFYELHAEMQAKLLNIVPSWLNLVHDTKKTKAHVLAAFSSDKQSKGGGYIALRTAGPFVEDQAVIKTWVKHVTYSGLYEIKHRNLEDPDFREALMIARPVVINFFHSDYQFFDWEQSKERIKRILLATGGAVYPYIEHVLNKERLITLLQGCAIADITKVVTVYAEWVAGKAARSELLCNAPPCQKEWQWENIDAETYMQTYLEIQIALGVDMSARQSAFLNHKKGI